MSDMPEFGMQPEDVYRLAKQLAAAEAREAALLAVIRDVHAQHADDLCWMDVDRIFAAAGLPVPDRSVGDKDAMHANCRRFIDTLCTGGKWRSYAELEASEAALRAALERYGRHQPDCMYREHHRDKCDCGYHAVLDAARRAGGG